MKPIWRKSSSHVYLNPSDGLPHRHPHILLSHRLCISRQLFNYIIWIKVVRISEASSRAPYNPHPAPRSPRARTSSPPSPSSPQHPSTHTHILSCTTPSQPPHFHSSTSFPRNLHLPSFPIVPICPRSFPAPSWRAMRPPWAEAGSLRAIEPDGRRTVRNDKRDGSPTLRWWNSCSPLQAPREHT